MNQETPDESQVLHWFERVLEQPPPRRRDWLAAQALPEWLHLRVARLLDADASLDDFLEHPAAAPEPEDFPRFGDRVGNYRLIDRIDAGGMGVVFLARRDDDSYEQEVAIKLIRPLHLAAGTGFRRQMLARFEQERALLARLRHPNIARILDGGRTAAGLPWLAMEYVDGQPLTAWCERHAAGVRERLRLLVKVCAGVQEAHRHLIVHRDLKPENILVGADGEPRLLDFGIARALEEGDGDAAAGTLTAMTPAYASPEQVRRQPLTTASDVYSLGVLLYQLLAGRRPYELQGLTPAEVERTVCDAPAPPLRATDGAGHRPPGTDADLERIVAKAMHKDAARRYGTAQELAADLQRWLDGEPVQAHPDSGAYRLRKFVSRHPAGVALAGVALLAVLGAAGLALWQAQQARRAAADLATANAFLLEVLQTSDPFDADSELTLSQALDTAAEGIDVRFAGRPELSAEIRFGIGYSMLSRWRLEQAEAQLARALRESLAAFGDADIRTLRVREAIAYLRLAQERGEEAETGFRDVIARLESGGHTGDALYGDALGNLGNLFLEREDYAAADTWLQRSLVWFDAHPQAPANDRANLYSNLAHAAHGLEDLDRADLFYGRAQEAMGALYPDGNPDLAVLLGNRALLAEDRGDLALAQDLHGQSLAMRRTVFKNDHPMVVTALAHVARMAVAQGDAAQAVALAGDAVAMADRVYPTPDSRHASACNVLAQAWLAAGDSAAATAALDRAEAMLERVDQPYPSVVEAVARTRTQLCARDPVRCRVGD